MSRGMVAFLAGLGGGYLKAKDKEYERQRQKKEDDWREEQRGWQKADRASADADKQALRDATAERTTMQGTAVTDGAGNANLYKDPTQAAAQAEEARIEAEMRGQSPDAVMTAPATGVTGNMSKGHQIASGPVDAAALNTREAKMGRVVNALMERGKPVEALGMENAVIDNKAKSLGLKSEELKFADQMFNRQLTEALSSSPNWYEGAAKVLTDTNVGGLAGTTVKPVLSDDGKTVNMVGVGQDGKERTLKSFKAGAEGQQEFMQSVARVDAATKIGWMAERSKTEYQQGRDKITDDRWQQTFDFNKKKEENDQQYRQRLLGFQAAQESRARQTHAIAMEDAKIPAAVKLRAQSLAKQMETVNSALAKAMAENSFDPNSANAKTLIEQQATLGLQYRELLTPYTPGAKGPTGLPDAGVFDKPGAAAAPAAAPAPAPGAGALPNADGSTGVPTRPAPPPAAPAATMQSVTAPALAPVVAPAQAPRPTLAQVLAGPSADPALQKLAAQRAQQMEVAASELRQAQAGVVAAAQRGDQKAVATAMQVAADAGARLDAFTKDMNPQQAAQARATLGL